MKRRRRPGHKLLQVAKRAVPMVAGALFLGSAGCSDSTDPAPDAGAADADVMTADADITGTDGKIDTEPEVFANPKGCLYDEGLITSTDAEVVGTDADTVTEPEVFGNPKGSLYDDGLMPTVDADDPGAQDVGPEAD